MKHEWRKHERELYLPKRELAIINIPDFKFFTIKGKGNPNGEHFSAYIEVLYALSYAVRMSYKTDRVPVGYQEYTVYPLEGVWDLSEQGRKSNTGEIDKDELIFTLMIRQPDFVTAEFGEEIIESVRVKKKLELLDQVSFESIEEGRCLQMMHIGPYDDEAKSFSKMQTYCDENGIIRKRKQHREIYLNDFRKVTPEKLKTVLRFEIL